MLLGDYLYAHGLVRIADAGGVEAVADDGRADLALRRAARRRRAAATGEAWIDAARALGGDPARRTRLADARSSAALR